MEGRAPQFVSYSSSGARKRPEDRFSSAHDLVLTLGALDATAVAPPVDEQSIIGNRWPHILAVAIVAIMALVVVLPPEALFERRIGKPADEPLPRIVVLLFENFGSPRCHDEAPVWRSISRGAPSSLREFVATHPNDATAWLDRDLVRD